MDIILHTFGTAISRDNAGFLIKTKNGEKKHIAPEGISTIQITKGIQITSDAIMLAVEKGIEVILLEKTGKPIGRFWSAQYGSISNIRKGQLIFSSSSEAVKWIKQIIEKKVLNQQALILALQTDSLQQNHEVEKAVSRLEEFIIKIHGLEGIQVRDIANTIRGWEGYASKIYFDTINHFIPEKYRFYNRSQHPALDVANALFNYAYGILYGKCESALITAGIDPYIGILHRDEYNRPVLIYDFIEVYRIWADYVVLSILCQDIITDEYYSTLGDGSVYLESLGRRIIIQSMNDYLDEIVNINGLNRSRATHVLLDAQSLASKFKTFYKTI